MILDIKYKNKTLTPVQIQGAFLPPLVSFHNPILWKPILNSGPVTYHLFILKFFVCKLALSGPKRHLVSMQNTLIMTDILSGGWGWG